MTGLSGIEHVRFGVIYDRSPHAAERLARQNKAILEALRWMHYHPDEVAETKKKHAEREHKNPVTWYRTRLPARVLVNSQRDARRSGRLQIHMAPDAPPRPRGQAGCSTAARGIRHDHAGDHHLPRGSRRSRS